MAASHQTGTASSPTDLLQKLVTWAVTQGWTSHLSQIDGNGWRAHLSKGGNYVNLRATHGNETIFTGGSSRTTTYIGIGLYVGTGYLSTSAWNAQAGGPIGAGQTYIVGAFMQTPVGNMTAYHFLDDGSDHITVVIERTPNIFTHMGWGAAIEKAGAWTGGAYFFAALSGFYGGETLSVWGAGTPDVTARVPGQFGDGGGCPTLFVRADVDGFTDKWLACGPNTLSFYGYGYTGKLIVTGIDNEYGSMPSEIPSYIYFSGRQVSLMNAQANLLPMRIFAQRDGSGYSLLGDLPNIFASNATSFGFASNSVYQIGSQNFLCFPNFMVQKFA